MDWEEYYDNFYDWHESIRISNISNITSYGAGEEICELAEAFTDDNGATLLVKKMLSLGAQFHPEEIQQLFDIVAPDLYAELLNSNSTPYIEDDLNYFYGLIDDELLSEIAHKSGIDNISDTFSQNGIDFETVLGAAGISSDDECEEHNCDSNHEH